MALVLGCKLGSGIRIGTVDGTTMVTVSTIDPELEVQLEVTDRLFKITDQERTEIMPDVFVSLGSGSSTKGDRYCRLVFEAPRSIRIERVDQKQAGIHA